MGNSSEGQAGSNGYKATDGNLVDPRGRLIRGEGASEQPGEFVSGGTSPPVDVHDFLRMKIVPPMLYWGDGLLNSQSRLIICGASKIRKTFLALNLAISLGAGRSFLDFEISKPVKVLYIQKEISRPLLQQRLRALLATPHRKPLPGFLSIQSVRDFDIRELKYFQTLKEWVKKLQPEVVIFDPLYQFHHADENSQQEMKRVLDRFDELIQLYGLSIVLVHHTRKKGNREWDSDQLMRGSVVLRDWHDALMMLFQRKNDRLAVKWQLRNAVEPERMTIVMDEQCNFQRVEKNEKETPEPEAKKVTAESIKKAMLSIAPQGEWVGQSRILKRCAELGMPSKTVRRRLEKYAGRVYEKRQLSSTERKGRKEKVVWRVL